MAAEAERISGAAPQAGGIAAEHAPVETPMLRVAATSTTERNTIREGLFPIACWRMEDFRFEFDSSIVRPDAAREMKELAQLVQAHPQAPLSLFGHADPVGSHEYNKALSGRRAQAVYALLVRRVDLWEQLYATKAQGVGDAWEYKAVQVMLAASGYDPGPVDGILGDKTARAVRLFQGNNGLAPDGIPGPSTRAKLFPLYMDAICRDKQGRPFKLTPADFLARGADTRGKGDYMGCGEFNPVLLFSASRSAELSAPHLGTERNAENAPNRRVVALMFRRGSIVSPSRWPCPTVAEGTGDCQKRLWSDSERRLKFQEKQREFALTADTFGCRFYHRLAGRSPCEGYGPVVICEVRVRPVRFAEKGNVLAVAERLDGKPFSNVSSIAFGSLALVEQEVWLAPDGRIFFIPPVGSGGPFREMTAGAGQVFPLQEEARFTADPVESVKSLATQMEVLRDALKLRIEQSKQSETPSQSRLRYDYVVVHGHRRLDSR